MENDNNVSELIENLNMELSSLKEELFFIENKNEFSEEDIIHMNELSDKIYKIVLTLTDLIDKI